MLRASDIEDVARYVLAACRDHKIVDRYLQLAQLAVSASGGSDNLSKLQQQLNEQRQDLAKLQAKLEPDDWPNERLLFFRKIGADKLIGAGGFERLRLAFEEAPLNPTVLNKNLANLGNETRELQRFCSRLVDGVRDLIFRPNFEGVEVLSMEISGGTLRDLATVTSELLAVLQGVAAHPEGDPEIEVAFVERGSLVVGIAASVELLSDLVNCMLAGLGALYLWAQIQDKQAETDGRRIENVRRELELRMALEDPHLRALLERLEDAARSRWVASLSRLSARFPKGLVLRTESGELDREKIQKVNDLAEAVGALEVLQGEIEGLDRALQRALKPAE